MVDTESLVKDSSVEVTPRKNNRDTTSY